MILFLSCRRKSFVFIEEPTSSLFNLALVDTPCLAKTIQDVVFLVQNFDCSVSSDVVESDYTIRNALRFYDPNPTDFCSVVSVSSTAGFSVYTLNVNHSKGVSRYNTTLVETEPIFHFCFTLVHKSFSNFNALAYNPISVVFNILFFLLCERFIVSDVQMGLLNCLLCTCLPNMRS